MPTKPLSCKKEPKCEHGPEAPSCPVGQVSFKMTVSKWKSVLCLGESKFDVLVGNHGRHVLWAKEEGDLPACHQRSVQKPGSLMVWGCISVYGMGSWHGLEGTMNAERYIKVKSNICSPPDDVYFMEGLVYFSRRMQNHILQLLQKAWLHSRRVQVLNWPACSPDLSPYREY